MYKDCPQIGDEELLSMQQSALWFIDNDTPGDSKYNISMAFRIHGSFQIDAFRYAANQLVAKNATLRSTFVNVNGEPKLVINEHLPPALEVFDATNLSQKALEDAVQNFHSIPFQLEKVSCLRFGIYVVSAEEYVLHMCVHHIVSDFTSLGLMWDQLEHYYLAGLGEDDDSWLPPVEDFKDYAVKERKYYQSEAAEESKAYWSECLKQPPDVLQWDSFWRKGANDKSSVLFSIGEETTKKIKRLASKIGGSVFTVMLAAWSAYIARETKTADIVMGVPVSMRHSVHRHIIGCLFNVLPIRLSVDQTFHHFLLAAKERLLSALDNRNFCLSQMVEHLAAERNDGRNPLFQVMVNMLGHVEQSRWVALEMAGDSVQVSWAGRTISPFRVCQQEGQIDIELLFVDAGSHLRCEFKADKHFFSHSGLQIFAERFELVVEALVAAPDEQLTTQCFTADPYIYHRRMYKTGDLAYWDGERIHFCGRVDDQVKVSGYRIEIAEIEDCLNRHHAIADAAVIVESYEGLDRLVAIFVPVSKDNLPEESAIRDHLKAYLPIYMLPGRMMLADELPRNAHNKIDRRALNGLIEAGQLTDISSLRPAPMLPVDSRLPDIDLLDSGDPSIE
ncbi:condensation domain-containing protein [Photorhabdus laumondii]